MESQKICMTWGFDGMTDDSCTCKLQRYNADMKHLEKIIWENIAFFMIFLNVLDLPFIYKYLAYLYG